MPSLEMIKALAQPTDSKIIMVVIDGLGGLPNSDTGKTELETARTPNMDALAKNGICGLSNPVGRGITPGSAPGHLALFGYDPACIIGRGALEALGIDFDLKEGDVAARGNFATMDKNGLLTDRRAGRISTEKNAEICRLLDGQEIDGVQVIVRPVKDHRLVVVFRGQNLDDKLTDSDPQRLSATALEVTALNQPSVKTAEVAKKFLLKAGEILAKHHPANTVLLRGFAKKPHYASMANIYQLKTAAIVSYPMYRGLARVVGMEVLPTGATISDEIETLKKHYADYNFFFFHVKATDSAGEDGDFKRKVAALEEADKHLAEIINIKPDVLVITGDHSTPATLKGHSWHPVPLIISAKWCRPDGVNQFGEKDCISGGLGQLPATDIMPLAMANALKLAKFGA